MLIHPWDTEDDWQGFVATQSVGTLIVPTDDLPVVVPTHYAWDGTSVLMHLARPNPALAVLRDRAVFSVHGAWAYVPAAWKAIGDEDPTLGVPTSYYTAVTLTCSVEVLQGEELLALLRTQLSAFEPGSDVADPAVHRRKLSGIRGLRLTPVEVRAKAKYGGNVDEAHRAAILPRLPEAARARMARRAD